LTGEESDRAVLAKALADGRATASRKSSCLSAAPSALSVSATPLAVLTPVDEQLSGSGDGAGVHVGLVSYKRVGGRSVSLQGERFLGKPMALVATVGVVGVEPLEEETSDTNTSLQLLSRLRCNEQPSDCMLQS